MGGLQLGGWVRFLTDQAVTRVVELNPVIIRRTDEEHLLDPEFHAEALDYRETRLLSSAARRLRAFLDDGLDSFEAMNRVQDHLLSLATAYSDRVICECFHDAVAAAKGSAVEPALKHLAALHALSNLESHRGWYLEAGYMEAGKTRAIRALVNRLCGQLATIAPQLVDGFAIPDAVLHAPDGVKGD